MGVVHTGDSHIASGKFGVDSSQYSFKLEVNGNSHLGTDSYVSSGGYHIDGGAYWRWQRDTGNNRLKLTRGDNLAEAVCVNTSNHMGIGTTAPAGPLHTKKNAASLNYSYVYETHGLSVESDEPMIQLMATDGGTHGGSVLWRYGDNVHTIVANPTTDNLDFISGAATANAFAVHGASGTSMSGYRRNMCIGNDGDVGIGTESPSYKLEVSGTFYSSGSSAIYKQDVQDYKPNTDAIMNLRPVNYEYIDEYKHFGKRLENNSPQIGLVAEEVAKIMPELAVMKEEDGKEVVRNVDYEKLTVVLLSEVQELKKELKALKEGI